MPKTKKARIIKLLKMLTEEVTTMRELDLISAIRLEVMEDDEEESKNKS